MVFEGSSQVHGSAGFVSATALRLWGVRDEAAVATDAAKERASVNSVSSACGRFLFHSASRGLVPIGPAHEPAAVRHTGTAGDASDPPAVGRLSVSKRSLALSLPRKLLHLALNTMIIV